MEIGGEYRRFSKHSNFKILHILIIHISNQLATFGIGAEDIVLVELMCAFATMIDLFFGSGNRL